MPRELTSLNDTALHPSIRSAYASSLFGMDPALRTSVAREMLGGSATYCDELCSLNIFSDFTPRLKLAWKDGSHGQR